MPEVVTLPHRGRDKANYFTDEFLDEIHEELVGLSDGQAVVLSRADTDGKPFTKDGSARNYARLFANAYQERFADEAPTDDDGTPRRLLSTHAILGYTSAGKPTGKFAAAVSNNTRETPITRQNIPADAPSRSDLFREIREWRKEHPRDRSFRNYTKWPYDTLRERVNAVTGYNDGIYRPPVEHPENGTNVPENGDETNDPEGGTAE